MSYILDALRKAESERKLGQAVGLHDQVLHGGANDTPPSHGTRRWWPLALGGAGLCLAAAFAWQYLSPSDAPVQSTVSGVVQQDAAAVAPSQPEVLAPSVPSSAHSKSPAPTNARQGSRASADVADAPARSKPATPSPTPQQAPESTQKQTQSEGEALPLSDDIRRQLPVLNVGGAMYSEQPASRMLVINGKLFHEGDSLGPELVLDTIALKSAVLRYRGQRYVLNY